MESRFAPRARLEPRAHVNLDPQGFLLGERLRELRSVLGPGRLPPPVVPLRAHIIDTGRGQQLFLELRNLSGLMLDGLGIEAVTLGADQREQDVMNAALSELAIAADPRRVVPVGGWALDPDKPATCAIITVVFARFADGSCWNGELSTLEDPRLSERERSRANERFFRPYHNLMSMVDGSATAASAN